MTKYRNSIAPSSTSTYDRDTIESPTENIYEALSIIAKRSNQINLDIRKELHEKLDEFATHNDSLEEIFENKEVTLSQIKFKLRHFLTKLATISSLILQINK